MKPEFDTSPFYRSHRKEPRGFGSWAFGPTYDADISEMLFSPGMTYTQAKKWAREQVPDARIFYVMP